MKFAQILNDKTHWIFEDDMTLEELYTHKFSKDHVTLVDITGNTEVQEGWNYDSATGKFSDPTPVVTLDELKESKTNLIDSSCQSAIVGGFFCITTGYSYDSTLTDQSNLQTAVIGAISGKVSVIPYRCYLPDGTKDMVNHTPEQFIAVFETFGQHLASNITKANELKKQITNASTAEELEDIIW